MFILRNRRLHIFLSGPGQHRVYFLVSFKKVTSDKKKKKKKKRGRKRRN